MEFSRLSVKIMITGMVSEAFGVLIAVVVEGQLIGKYRKTGDCADNGETSDDQIENEVNMLIVNNI